MEVVNDKDRKRRRSDLDRDDRISTREGKPRINDWFNAHTGEEAQGLMIVRGARYPKGTEFNTMFRSGWEYLADLDLKKEETKTLFKLLSRLDYENWIGISQETLAEEMGMRQPHVARSITALIGHGIIEKERDPADKRRSMYRLDARLGWKGDAADWARHIQSKTGTNVIPMPGMALQKNPYPPPPKRGPAHPDQTDIEDLIADKIAEDESDKKQG